MNPRNIPRVLSGCRECEVNFVWAGECLFVCFCLSRAWSLLEQEDSAVICLIRCDYEFPAMKGRLSLI